MTAKEPSASEPRRSPENIAPSQPAKTDKTAVAGNTEVSHMYKTIPNTLGSKPAGKSGKKKDKKSQSKTKRIIKRVLLVLLAIVLAIGLYVGGKFLYNTIKVFGWGGVTDVLSEQKLRGEDEGRVNILLAGNSTDDPGHSGAALTDSIMVVSLSTDGGSSFVMSIPRDLYVDIPDNGYAKINEAYQDGQNDNFSEPGYPEGGMGLLQKTVSEILGIPIHYYALVNYGALQQAVDAVGGIDIVVESSDPRGLYDAGIDYTGTRKALVKLPNGQVHLNGRDALNLARARGSTYGSYGFAESDFTRTEHQRKILVALAQKTRSLGTLGNPLKVTELFDAFGNNVQTNFSAGEGRRLATLLGQTNESSLTSASLNDANGKNLLASYRTPNGQSALVPAAGVDNYSQIQAYIQQLSAPPPPPEQTPPQ